MDRTIISIGSINIYWYSVIILIAVLVGSYVAYRESKVINRKDYFESLIFNIIVFGIIGARLYYVIFNFELYKDDILSIFKIWEGGLAIYGGIIGGLVAILFGAKKHCESVIETIDMVVPGLILAQAIGRWGNFFNSEAHGGEVTLSYLEKLHLPKFIIDGMCINGVYYHPTFLYESLWCLLGFIFIIVIRKVCKRKKGIVTYSYFIWYGIGRIFIEHLRTDSLYLGSIKVSQLVSLILLIIGIIGIIKTKMCKNSV